MKLYIKQKVFSWNNKFSVMDEYGRDRYYVEGELFSWGHKLHVYDVYGREVAFISEKVWSFLRRYTVAINGVDVAEIVREFTFFRPSYTINGVDWAVDGHFWEHDYEIYGGGKLVASIRKEWMTWGDCYELDVTDSENELLALTVVLTIDCVLASQNN